MKIQRILPFLALLVFLPSSGIRASVLSLSAPEQTTHVSKGTSTPRFNAKKIGLFQKFKLLKASKKRIHQLVQGSEEASKFAKLAMTMFAVSLVLSVLSVFVPLFSVLGGIGFVASLVMAIYILVKEKNPKSRKLARTILIVSATLILLSLILALLLIGLFITLLV